MAYKKKNTSCWFTESAAKIAQLNQEKNKQAFDKSYYGTTKRIKEEL